MDCSEEVQAVFEEPTAEMELKKGMSIFIDVTSSAGFYGELIKTNLAKKILKKPKELIKTHYLRAACLVMQQDDGKLSFDEFKSYFSDGVLTAEELQELFHTIDTHNTDNVDTDELCEYFSQHLGEYENVLGALEDLNMCILKAMDKTKKDYQESSHLEQFVTRFLLKETTNQLHSLQSSLECAMETTAEQTRQEKQGPLKPEVLSIQWSGRRSNRRLQRNSSLSPNNPLLSLVNSGVYEEDSQWMVQVNRLQRLIDRLEKKEIRLEPVEEEVLESKSHILIVQRQLSVLEDELEEFRLALRQYMDCACAQTGCLHIAVQRLANESRFILYEFWEHNSVWKNHLQTNYSKTFQRGNVDFLETPESLSTMLVPVHACVFVYTPRRRFDVLKETTTTHPNRPQHISNTIHIFKHTVPSTHFCPDALQTSSPAEHDRLEI
ncbi:N-terminal EF-hand calcium-binding protein 1 [Dissostichus eleginoides]|nr:N-terminal EF-hand calcium-binding protein 1 [Dissostichus eleginoides]